MKKRAYKVKAKIWLYPGENASWHFLTVPKKESSAITIDYGSLKRGWGSLPVLATIGKTSWNTSIFPDSKSGTYLLPVKALVRRKEGVENGDSVTFSIAIMP